MKTWRIELEYQGMAGFSSLEMANTLPAAIDQAIRYARSLGWPPIPIKRRAFEVTTEDLRISQGVQA